MAEFLENNKKPARVDYGDGGGFDAFGKFVDPSRRAAAYQHCKQMGLIDPQEAWECVNGMAEQVARDQPYEAIRIGMRYVDLTGCYRLLAVLCTEALGGA